MRKLYLISERLPPDDVATAVMFAAVVALPIWWAAACFSTASVGLAYTAAIMSPR